MPLISAGKWLLVCVLAVPALAAIISGRLGWQNYWGGFVYAPFALLVAALLVIVIVKGK
jgi:hypothetical protein